MKELKDCLVLGFDLLHGVEKSAANGKWDPVADPLNFTPVLRDLPVAVQGITLVPSEIKAAQPQDWDELLDWAKATFDLDDDTVEAKVEAALEVVGGLVRGWAAWPKAVG